ncbi:MAG: hypothetical protein ACI3W8_05730 [Oscillospiraceae bacterium]
MKEISGKQRKAFCRAFLRCMDPKLAAEECRVEDGYALLETAEVQQELERMRQAMHREIRREDVLRGLARLAFSTAEGVDGLLLPGEEATAGRIDFSAVAEVKRSSSGIVELRFVDRIKALATLYELLGSGEGDGAEAFFRALQEAGE